MFFSASRFILDNARSVVLIHFCFHVEEFSLSRRTPPVSKSPQGGRARSRKPSRPKNGRKIWIWVFSLVLAMVLGAAGGITYWLNSPLGLKTATVEVQIEAHSSPGLIARQLSAAGIDVNPDLLYQWFKFSGKARAIKAGSYEFSQNQRLSPVTLLNKLVRGDQSMRVVTFVEGWTFRQMRAALAKAPDLKPTSAQWDEATLMQALGRPGLHPEGRFFPDTYQYAKGSADTAVLARALTTMDRQLNKAWEARSADIAVHTPDEALILASIVEKETGLPSDRGQIAAVFNNRLRIGMRLQTDPTVIYGLGASFDGNLRKADLLADTAYNTYTRNGLPPTPIAMPGKASLMAALHPASSRALYFVAKGDGSSYFSETLAEHNRAVNQYIRGQ